MSCVAHIFVTVRIGGKCEPPASQVPIRCGQSPALMSCVAHMPSASKLADVAFATVPIGGKV